MQQPHDLTPCLQQPRIEIRRSRVLVVRIDRGEHHRPAVGAGRLYEQQRNGTVADELPVGVP